jgi:hypothetical protein
MILKIKQPTHCGFYPLNPTGRQNALKMLIRREVLRAKARKQIIEKIIIYKDGEPVREQATLC